MNENDTIIAAATPQGFGMRAIVRLSGPDALRIAGACFEPAEDENWRKGFTVRTGSLNLARQKVHAPVALYTMRAPRSYTGEDVTELHVPGSPPLVDMILDELLQSFPDALRIARPGEFTQRAFLNGRIDLLQAEAVMAIVKARNMSELKAANAALMGSASRLVSDLRAGLLDLRAGIEAALDFEAQGIETVSRHDFLRDCRKLRENLAHGQGVESGTPPPDGRIGVAICGPPNAGKSSILNRLSGRRNAIVHQTAGTTRDPVEESVDIDGLHFTLTDTAGLNGFAAAPDAGNDAGSGAAGDIDAVAAGRAKNAFRNARLVVLVFDSATPVPSGWSDIGDYLEKDRTLCVLNKCDLPQVVSPGAFSDAVREVMRVSALSGEGLGKLKSAMAGMVLDGVVDASPADCLFNARQREAISRAVLRIIDAEQAVESGLGFEFAALDLQDAASALAEVIDGTGTGDVLDRVFSRFCIGK